MPTLLRKSCIAARPSAVGSIEQPITGVSLPPGGNARSATTRSCNCSVGRPLVMPTTRPVRSVIQPLRRTGQHDVLGLGEEEDVAHALQPGEVTHHVGRGALAVADRFLQAVERDLPQRTDRRHVGLERRAGRRDPLSRQTPVRVRDDLLVQHALGVHDDAGGRVEDLSPSGRRARHDRDDQRPGHPTSDSLPTHEQLLHSCPVTLPPSHATLPGGSVKLTKRYLGVRASHWRSPEGSRNLNSN